MTQPTSQLEKILEIVSDYSGVRIDDMKSKKRHHHIIIGRRRFCYLARLHTKCSLREIGEVIGDRDHTTIIYTLQEFENVLDKDPKEFDHIREMEKKIEKEGNYTLEELMKLAQERVGAINQNINDIIDRAWQKGFEDGKKTVPIQQVKIKTVIKKIYVPANSKIEPEKKPFERHKGVYSNPSYQF